MLCILDLSKFEEDKDNSFYNHIVYKHKDFDYKIKLKYIDDSDVVNINIVDGDDWKWIGSTSYYHDFNHEKPIEFYYNDLWY